MAILSLENSGNFNEQLYQRMNTLFSSIIDFPIVVFTVRAMSFSLGNSIVKFSRERRNKGLALHPAKSFTVLTLNYFTHTHTLTVTSYRVRLSTIIFTRNRFFYSEQHFFEATTHLHCYCCYNFDTINCNPS